MKWIVCAQGSPEWHAHRAGCITASKFWLARDRYQTNGKSWIKGELKKEALDYAFRLAVERISGIPLDEGYETFWMERGHDLEPDARRRHEIESGQLVQRVGFVKTDDGYFGASLDGIIGDDGAAEYKAFVDPAKLRAIWIDGDIGDIEDQVQGQLWITARKWCDVVLYCPALAITGKDIWCKRFYRDEDYIALMELDLVKFLKIVNDYEKVLRAPLASNDDAAAWPFPQQAA